MWKTSSKGMLTGELSGLTSMMSDIMSHHFCVIGSTFAVSWLFVSLLHFCTANNRFVYLSQKIL